VAAYNILGALSREPEERCGTNSVAAPDGGSKYFQTTSVVRFPQCFPAPSSAERRDRRSYVRRSGRAHGINHALALREKHGVVALAESAQALDRKFRVDCKTAPDRCAGFVKPPQVGEAGGQIKVGPGIVRIVKNKVKRVIKTN
jgi:hypothetical protein